MKNNFNPYTVPEHFFEETCDKAVSGYRKRNRALRHGIAAAVLAALIIAVPAVVHSISSRTIGAETAANNLAKMYEYDIFLQVNF